MKTGKHLYGSMTQHDIGVAQQERRLHAQHTLGLRLRECVQWVCPAEHRSDCWVGRTVALLPFETCLLVCTQNENIFFAQILYVFTPFSGVSSVAGRVWPQYAPSCSSASPVACGSKTMENYNFLILPHRVPSEASSFDFWMSLMLTYLQSCFQVKMNELSVRNQENEFCTDIKSLKE